MEDGENSVRRWQPSLVLMDPAGEPSHFINQEADGFGNSLFCDISKNWKVSSTDHMPLFQWINHLVKCSPWFCFWTNMNFLIPLFLLGSCPVSLETENNWGIWERITGLPCREVRPVTCFLPRTDLCSLRTWSNTWTTVKLNEVWGSTTNELHRLQRGLYFSQYP